MAATEEEAQRIAQQFRELRQAEQVMLQKIAEMEHEDSEHRVVLESLRGMSDDRKCYRLVGGVLAERTVGEVRPDLEASQAGIRKLIENLHQELTKATKRREDFQKAYNIRVTTPGGMSAPAAGMSEEPRRAAAGGGGAGGGILV